ncbi:hypothetical protein Tco_0066944 [Tanacetum coccineum]
MASNDPILTIMRFIPKHESVQKYDAIIPDTLTNQAMKDSDAYKTYYDLATGKVIPKPKYVRRSTREKTDQAPKESPGKRLKSTTKVAKSGKKKLPAQDFLKSSDDEDDDEVSKSKDNDDNADNEDDDGQDDVNDQTKSDNNGDDFVHPKFSTHDKKERQYEEDREEEGSDLRVQAPSHFESTNDEAYDEVTQGVNVEGEELNEEEINEEEEVNELYKDVNINLEGRDTEMTDAPQTNVQGTQVTEDTHVIITAATPKVQQQSSYVSPGFISNMLNPNPDTCIDSILNLNTESTSLVDVPVTMNVEIPPLSITTLLPPHIPFFQPQQQTHFEDRVKGLEDDFLEFKQTNQFAEAVSSIPGIVDTYLANKINEAVKTVVQLQSDRLRDEAQAKNEDFSNTLDENMRKIIKKQVKKQVSKILPKIEKLVNDPLKAEVLTRSSNQAKTSHVVAANLFELELKKILIDKIDNNKSIDRSSQQKTLYKALVDAYEIDKDILETYGDTVTFKRCQDDKDEDEEPSAGSTEGPREEELEKNLNQLVRQRRRLPSQLASLKKGPNLIKILMAIQPWISTLAQKKDPRESFNKLMDTSLDFSAFMMNRLKVDTLTSKLLADPIYELMKGSCKSLGELEYFLEEVCKATIDQLDWNNPKGQQYPHDLRKPLPLIPNSRGRRVIPFDHFVNNDLAYLSSGVSSRTYATSVTKTKAADYEHIKWIEDFIPNSMRIRRNGDYNRLRLQDIEDMLLLLVQGKLTNLNIEERLALGVSMQMLT